MEGKTYHLSVFDRAFVFVFPELNKESTSFAIEYQIVHTKPNTWYEAIYKSMDETTFYTVGIIVFVCALIVFVCVSYGVFIVCIRHR